MKHALLAAPLLALLSAPAVAQGDAADDGRFGTGWPLSFGTVFFDDAESENLRTDTDMLSSWDALSEPDQEMIRSDCEAFSTAHGDSAESGSAAAPVPSAQTGAAGGEDAAGAAEQHVAGQPGQAGTQQGAAPSATGYSLAQMQTICEEVQDL